MPLKHLEVIAAGNANQRIFEALRKDFDRSQSRVSAAMKKLKEARGKLAESRIAAQIDRIVRPQPLRKASS